MADNSRYYKSDSDTARIIWATMLANQNPDTPSQNVFRTHNLIGRVKHGTKWNVPIGHVYDVSMEQGGYFRSFLTIPLRGEPTVHDPDAAPGTGGAQVGRHTDTYLARPSFQFRTQKVSGIKMALPDEFYETLVSSAIFEQQFNGLRDWYDALYSDWLHTYAAGSAGYGRARATIRSSSRALNGDPGTNASNEAPMFQMAHKGNPLRRPSRLFAAWESVLGSSGGSPAHSSASATNTSHKLTINHIQDINTYLKQRTAIRDGIGFDPASFMDPGSESGDKIGKGFMLLAPPECIKDLKQANSGQNWWTLQLHTAASNKESGIVTGIIGQVDASNIIEDDNLSRFRNDSGVPIARILIMGAQALCYGHKLDRRPVRLRARWDLSGGYRDKVLNVPYRLWVTPRADGDSSAIASSTMFGCAMPTYEDEEGNLVTKGMAASDVVFSRSQPDSMA